MLKYPFLILSDIHMNDWSQFSHIMANKLNSRLHEQLEAVSEAVDALGKAGGKDIVVTGDLFHTRGKIKPSVFNPTFDLFRQICSEGYRVWMIPGNHDLEGKDSDTIGNATHPFNAIEGCTVFNEVSDDGSFVFLPWIEHKEDFVNAINAIENPKEKVVFCHIGIDGVLDKVNGKVGKAVLDRGFKYVFAGDYHNFKALGDGVYSVGALTHHNFGDTNATAGYLLVSETEVKQCGTRAPKFVHGGDKASCFGNVVRLTGEMEEEEAEKLIKAHYDYGAIYVQDLTTRPSLEDDTHSATVVKVDLNIETAIGSYVKHKYGAFHEEVLEEALRLKNEHV
jgi:DNA repair exonuclease SbcCD nuclease subunit